jgi:catechol 2,3-dioxygenase-like lactoylglutathione lyase family enzyme
VIVGFNHTSFTVANLNRAVQFWTEGLGFRATSVSERTGAWQGQVTGIPGAKLKIAHLVGYGHHMEFIEYLEASDNSVTLQPNSAGVAHVGLEVEDIEDTINTLATMGATPQGKLIEVDSGPFTGCRAIYMRDPNGVIIELEEIPKKVNGERYEGNSA